MKNIYELIIEFIQDNPINISKLERSVKIVRDNKVVSMPTRTIQNYINGLCNNISTKYLLPLLRVLSRLGMTINDCRFDVKKDGIQLLKTEKQKGITTIKEGEFIAFKDLVKKEFVTFK